MINLEELYIGFNDELVNIDPLRNLNGLKSLSISECYNIVDYSPLLELSNLEFLVVSYNAEADYTDFYNINSLDFNVG